MAVTIEKEMKDYKLNIRAEVYQSTEELVHDCQTRPVKIQRFLLDHDGIHKDWHGVGSYSEALELLKNGYQPTVKDLEGGFKVSDRQGYVPRFQFSNCIQGFAPVVPLALIGVPNNMMNMRMTTIKQKVIDVYYDMTANAGTDPEEFIEAGKSLLETVIELEKKGYRFNLYAVQTYTGHCDGQPTADMLCVKVKSSDKPLDLKRMSFPLTHPAFFRVIGFDWEGKSPICRDIGYGRGRAFGYDYDDKQIRTAVHELLGDNACYISCAKFIRSKYDTKVLKEAFLNDKKTCNS